MKTKTHVEVYKYLLDEQHKHQAPGCNSFSTEMTLLLHAERMRFSSTFSELCNRRHQWLLTLSSVSYTFQSAQKHPVCQSSPQSLFASLPVSVSLFVPSCVITCLLNICDGGQVVLWGLGENTIRAMGSGKCNKKNCKEGQHKSSQVYH